jgi:hypothetical protein
VQIFIKGEIRKEKGITKEEREKQKIGRGKHGTKENRQKERVLASETIIIHSWLERRNRHKLKCIIAVR